MLLKRGVTIHSYLPGVDAQVMINDGTMKPGKSTGLYYYPDSYIPKRKWRNLSNAEQKTLLSSSDITDYRKNIFIGIIPADLRKSLMSLGLHDCTNINQVMPEVKKQEKKIKTLSKKLDTYLRPFSSTGVYKFHRLTLANPNWETITNYYFKNQHVYIGLHVDGSRKFTPYTAFRSGNRISINLSKETRYLAMVNLTLIQTVNMIKERSGLPYSKINSDNISTLFFKHCPDYPAVKFGIKPYQYYIAPTDNFFHDATTLGNTAIDITFVYTGLFDMPAKNQLIWK
jgi:hypothetical protein